MADRLFRMEKERDDKTTTYVEFQREAQNVIVRLWSEFDSGGRIMARSEKEHFHTTPDADTYVKGQRDSYLRQGYKVTMDSQKPIKKPTEKPAEKPSAPAIAADDLD